MDILELQRKAEPLAERMGFNLWTLEVKQREFFYKLAEVVEELIAEAVAPSREEYE